MLTNNKYNTRSYAYCFEQVDKGIFINKHLESPSSFVVVHLFKSLPSSFDVTLTFLFLYLFLELSNASDNYLRNKLRHNVIPILKELNQILLHSFQNTISNLKQAQSLVDDLRNQDLNDDEIKELLRNQKNIKSWIYDVYKKVLSPEQFKKFMSYTYLYLMGEI